MFNSRKSGMNQSLVKLTFQDEVIITKSEFAPLSISELFSTLGGVIGLWLGVGMLQIVDHGMILAKLCSQFTIKGKKDSNERF